MSTYRFHVPLATLLYGLASAITFAISDILILSASVQVGTANAIVVESLTIGLCTLLFYPLVLGIKVWKPPYESAFKWLFPGVLLFGIQSLAIVLSLTLSSDATAPNVFYASRCIWGVLLTWWVARSLGFTESKLKISTMALRTVGAGFLFTAIWIVLL